MSDTEIINNKLWTKDFFIDSAINFFVYLVFYLLMVIIVSYVMNDLGGSAGVAGLIFGIFVVGLLISRIACGNLINRVGEKRMLYIGISLYLLTTLLYFTASNIASLFFIRFINGIAMGIATTATGTVIGKIIPPARRGEGTGYFALTMPVASAVGSSLGIYINRHGGFNTILIVGVILLLVSFIGVFFLKTPQSPAHKPPEQTKKFALNKFFEISIWPISIVSILVGVSYSGVLSFMASYTKSIGQIQAGSIFFIVYALFILLSRPFTGKLFDRKGENYVMYPAFILFILGLAILGMAQNAFMIFISAAFVGFGYGTYISSAQAISIKEAPFYRMGVATSTFYASVDLGVGAGPFILGTMIPSIGYRPMYIILAVLVAVGMVVYYYLYGRKISKKRRNIPL